MKMYILLFGFLLLFGCDLFNNEQDQEFFRVTPVSSIEVALELHAEIGDEIFIERDGNEVFSFRMSSADSILIDSGLEPATSYIWKADNQSRGGRWRPVEKQATTLDTTSHNFAWQKFEFGEDSYSVIRDVAVIDENNIWAVGEIYMSDSLGNPQETPYNVLHWNGKIWKPLRLKWNCRLYYPNCGPVTELYDIGNSIIAFDSTDIWIASGAVHHFDGEIWRQEAGILYTGNANAIWGSSSEDMWFVGNGGFIAHYNGQSWQNLESGTSLNINDIWGSKNLRTGDWEILAVASEPWNTVEEQLLSISGNDVRILPSNEPDLIMNAIWFEAGRTYYIGGNDLFQTYSLGGNWYKDQDFEPGFLGAKQAIHGNALNDLIVVGTHGLVSHFNGSSWKIFENQLLLPFGSGSYTSLEMKGNIVVAGGGHNSKGIVLIGRRE